MTSQPPLSLVRWLMGVPITQAIYAAAKLDLARLLEDGPKTSLELADLTGADATALWRLLRMLVSVGIVSMDGGDRFALSPTGRFLRDDEPGSVRNLAILGGEPWHLGSWASLLESVRTGKPVFDRLHGCSFFEFLEGEPACAEIFDRAMDAVVGRFAPAVAAVCPVERASTVVDVGGGRGTLLGEILSRRPTLRGVLFEAPAAIAGAEERLRALGLLDRCATVSGDFFVSVPDGGDVYILSHVLHNWNDESAVTILRNCRRAMRAESRLLVAEILVTAVPDFYGSWLDLEMLVNFGGKERTRAEYERLFDEAGLRAIDAIKTESPITLLDVAVA